MSINEHPDNMASLLRWKDERIRELEAENAKLRDELAEIEATTVPSGQYLNVVAQCDKLRAELERRKLKWQTGPVPDKNTAYLWRYHGGKAIYLHLVSDATQGMEWAGPIEPPEEE